MLGDHQLLSHSWCPTGPCADFLGDRWPPVCHPLLAAQTSVFIRHLLAVNVRALADIAF